MPGSARVDAQVEDEGDGESRGAGGARQRRMDEMFVGSSRAIADAWASPRVKARTPVRGTTRQGSAWRTSSKGTTRPAEQAWRTGPVTGPGNRPKPNRGRAGRLARASGGSGESFGGRKCGRDRVPLSSASRGRRDKGKNSTLKVGF
eukprot:SAG31_NODE_1109_length_9860_cov_22.119353_5_plen_147_part_00